MEVKPVNVHHSPIRNERNAHKCKWRHRKRLKILKQLHFENVDVQISIDWKMKSNGVLLYKEIYQQANFAFVNEVSRTIFSAQFDTCSPLNCWFQLSEVVAANGITRYSNFVLRELAKVTETTESLRCWLVVPRGFDHRSRIFYRMNAGLSRLRCRRLVILF